MHEIFRMSSWYSNACLYIYTLSSSLFLFLFLLSFLNLHFIYFLTFLTPSTPFFSSLSIPPPFYHYIKGKERLFIMAITMKIKYNLLYPPPPPTHPFLSRSRDIPTFLRLFRDGINHLLFQRLPQKALYVESLKIGYPIPRPTKSFFSEIHGRSLASPGHWACPLPFTH